MLTPQQVREFDRLASEQYGIPSRVLMENAGRGVADYLLRAGVGGPVLVLCGKGNNGGDGFVIARHLDGAGEAVRVLLAAPAEQLRGDAADNLAAARQGGMLIEELPAEASPDEVQDRFGQAASGAAWIVDALLGVGVDGDPRPPFDQLIRLANEHSARRLAVDVPSGLNAATGEAGEPTFQAEVTCTFAAAKPGLVRRDAEPLVGDLQVLPLGVPRALLARFQLAK